MSGTIELKLSGQQALNPAAHQLPAVVVLELDADSLDAVAVASGWREPDHAPRDWQLVGVIHEADEHEDLVA